MKNIKQNAAQSTGCPKKVTFRMLLKPKNPDQNLVKKLKKKLDKILGPRD